MLDPGDGSFNDLVQARPITYLRAAELGAERHLVDAMREAAAVEDYETLLAIGERAFGSDWPTALHAEAELLLLEARANLGEPVHIRSELRRLATKNPNDALVADNFAEFGNDISQ